LVQVVLLQHLLMELKAVTHLLLVVDLLLFQLQAVDLVTSFKMLESQAVQVQVHQVGEVHPLFLVAQVTQAVILLLKDMLVVTLQIMVAA
jgi:hypothetical protein